MLKSINPLLTPELLYVMAAMGHGDELAVVDANFPAYSVAHGTTNARAVPMAGVSMPEAVSAILSLLPLDEFVDSPVRSMAGGGAPGELPEVQQEVQAVIDAAAGRPLADRRIGTFCILRSSPYLLRRCPDRRTPLLRERAHQKRGIGPAALKREHSATTFRYMNRPECLVDRKAEGNP